jgi:putative flippase GtrA
VAEAKSAFGLGERSYADRFRLFTGNLAGRLPLGLDQLVAPTLVGFVVINGSTFALDLALLTVLRSGFGLVLPAAFTVAYLTAFATSFVLNRWLNFRSHAPVGRQAAVYAVVVAINYLAFILSLATALSAAGLEYHLSRIVAGLCEAAYMYAALRWVVFRDRR